MARATSTAGAAWDRPIWVSSSRSASVSGRRGSFLRRDMAASVGRRPLIVARRGSYGHDASHMTHYGTPHQRSSEVDAWHPSQGPANTVPGRWADFDPDGACRSPFTWTPSPTPGTWVNRMLSPFLTGLARSAVPAARIGGEGGGGVVLPIDSPERLRHGRPVHVPLEDHVQ